MPGQFEGILDKLQTKLGKQTIKRASTIARPKPRPDEYRYKQSMTLLDVIQKRTADR